MFQYQSSANRAKNAFLRRSQATITTPLPFSYAKAIADYERQLELTTEQSVKDAATIKELQAKLAEASVEAVKASEATAKLSADSAVSALEATKLILERAESLEASRKAESLDGFTPEPAK